MEKDETWTSDEYGRSHEGRVGVLLDDGSVPKPVYFDSASGSSGCEVRHWSVYDGAGTYLPRPRADVLRAECSCGWTGAPHAVDWATAGDPPFHESGLPTAEQCEEDWDSHLRDVAGTTIPLPAELEALFQTVTAAIENLAQDSPTAALKAARTLELIAQRTAHWPAQDARAQDLRTVAADLGLSVDATRGLLARFGGWQAHG
ncbi:hypothetical protein OG906_34365 [Streptomyces sp. NBC_01426]|uniref:hypothetical protein n=1 Tax=Streptomyces sp. NBC_01426 TaxID=2975866 RepID=UPI002E329D27|nr:hypothetical protein [Streptomyces sp. NBC_01426]